METSAAALLCVAGLTTILSFVWSRSLYRILERKHLEVWRSLGSPTLFNNSIQNGRAVKKFVWKRQDLKLDDSELSAIANRIRTLWLVHCGIIGAWFILFGQNSKRGGTTRYVFGGEVLGAYTAQRAITHAMNLATRQSEQRAQVCEDGTASCLLQISGESDTLVAPFDEDQ